MLILASTRHQTASSTWFHINRFGGSDWIPQVEKSWWQAIDFLKRLYFLSLIATADSEHLCVSHAKACAVEWWTLLTRDGKTLTSWLRFALNEFSCVYILSTPSPLLLVGWGIGTEARCLHLQMLRCITEVCLMLLTTLLVEFQATLCNRESNDPPFGTFFVNSVSNKLMCRYVACCDYQVRSCAEVRIFFAAWQSTHVCFFRRPSTFSIKARSKKNDKIVLRP